MPKVQSYADLYVAQMLVDELLRAGIQARLSNTDLVGMVPGVPFTTAYCEVWVDDLQLVEEAEQIARQFEDQRKAQPDPPDDEPAQRVHPTPPTFGSVVFWMAAASFPGTVVYCMGLDLAGAVMVAVGAMLAYIGATWQHADYCSRCRSPLAAGAASCPSCHCSIAGELAQQQHEQRGGMTRTLKGLGLGMLVFFFALVAISWCTQGPDDQRVVPRPWSGRRF